MNTLMRMYLLREEGLIDLSNEEITENIKMGVEVFGSESKLEEALLAYLEE